MTKDEKFDQLYQEILKENAYEINAAEQYEKKKKLIKCATQMTLIAVIIIAIIIIQPFILTNISNM